jgi:soluble lytic murein transglycosylase-like protein
MPANFGEIANYHSRLAAQHMALARAARDAGDDNAAEYNRELAARYIEAAEEQKTAMSQAPGRQAANQAPRPWAQKPSQLPKPIRKPAAKPVLKAAPMRTPLALTCLSALRRGAGSVATALQQSLSHANASLQHLALQEAPPAPPLRG